MIDVLNMVKVYEVDGTETATQREALKMKVSSHWNRSSMVNISVDGRQFTVLAKDLIAAIHNAQNSASI